MKRRDILKLAMLSGLYANFSFIQTKSPETSDVNGYFGLRELDIPLGGIKQGQSYIFTYVLDNKQNVLLESDIFKKISNSLNYNYTEDLNNDISITLVETISKCTKDSKILVWNQGEEFYKFFKSIYYKNFNYVKLTIKEEMDLINGYLDSEYIQKQKEYLRSKLIAGYSVIYIGYARLKSVSNFVEYLNIDGGSPCNFISISFSKYLVDDFAKPGDKFIPYKIVNTNIVTEGVNFNTKLYYNIFTELFENKNFNNCI